MILRQSTAFSQQSRKLIGDAPKNIFLNVCWLDPIINFGSGNFKYNPNLLFGMYDFYSSTHGGMLLVMYMGFKEIYLIGVDNGYTEKRRHFDDNGDSEKVLDELARNDKVFVKAKNRAYVELDIIAKKKGINIFNCTRSGLLEVFPRKELEEVVSAGGVSHE